MSPRVEFTPVVRRRLSVHVAECIHASIVADELRPGDRLPPILEMARTFGVAVPTVREALILLEAKHVVDIRHGTGVFIAANAA